MDNIQEVYRNRRSVKYFDPNQPLSDELLEKIVNMAVLAPSSMNIQPWEIYVIKSKDARQKLYDHGCDQEKVLKAPASLLIIGNTLGYKEDAKMWEIKLNNGMSKSLQKKIIKNCDEKLYSNEIKKNAFAVRNSSLLAMSLMYAAKHFDVDTHPMIGFEEDQVKDAFDIDEHKTVTMIISIGYRDQSKELKPRKHRLQYDEITKEF
jgi:nitroreductase